MSFMSYAFMLYFFHFNGVIFVYFFADRILLLIIHKTFMNKTEHDLSFTNQISKNFSQKKYLITSSKHFILSHHQSIASYHAKNIPTIKTLKPYFVQDIDRPPSRQLFSTFLILYILSAI